MGPDNTSLWSHLGVSFSKENQTFFIEHPNDASRKLFLCPDLVHILKNLTCSFRLTPVLFPPSIVEKFNLASNTATFADVQKVYDMQNEKVPGKEASFKIAPKLTGEVMKPTQWEKMRESIAYDLISPDVTYALDLVSQNSDGKKNATSFYFEILHRLKTILLNPDGWSMENKEQFEEDMQFLKFLADDFFSCIQIPIKRGYVKSLNGAVVSLKSLREISMKLVDEGAEKIYPKHILNNSVENIFSQTTQRFAKVDSAQFVAALKAISLTHYAVPVRGSSYNFEDGSGQSIKLDFLRFMKEFIGEQEIMLQDEAEEIETHEREIPSQAHDELFANNLQEFGFHRDIARIINNNAEILSQCEMCAGEIKLIQEGDEDHLSLSCMAVKLFSQLEFCFRTLSKEDENDEHCLAALRDDFERNFKSNASKIEEFNHCPELKMKLVDDFFKLRREEIHRRRYLHKINPYSSKGLSSGVSKNSKESKKSTQRN
jgi:hypothetical protein